MINLALLLTRTQNYVWVSVKLYNQHKNENQSPSVKNSHQCHYSRLWKYIHQISYRSHRRSVNVGGHLVYFKKKRLTFPAITNPVSLIPTVSLSLSLPLTVSFSQATRFLRPSISSSLTFSLSRSASFIILFPSVLPHSHACSLGTLSCIKEEPEGFEAIRVATRLFLLKLELSLLPLNE